MKRRAGIIQQITGRLCSKVIPLLTVLLIFGAARVFALDYGMVFSGEAAADQSAMQGATLLAPWFSLPLGSADFFVSLGATVNYGPSISFVPELLEMKFTWQISPSLGFRAGRILWQDISGFVVRGRMDGVDLLLNLGQARLGAAAFYTGFLYNDTADLAHSRDDPKNYNTNLDWADFAGTYFAPCRVIASLYGEFPGFPFSRGTLYAGLLAQFDLSGIDSPLHSQYALARYRFNYKQFSLNAGGAVELEQTTHSGLRPAFAASLDGGWQIPMAFNNRISLGVRWASGEGGTASFFPLIRESQGFILKPGLSGIMIIHSNFQINLLPSLTADMGVRYFLRTDSVSFRDADIDPAKKSYALGGELNAALLWIPFSDLSFSCEGGIFFPGTGTAMRSDAPVRWALTLGTIFSF